jgi:hypothetical protein
MLVVVDWTGKRGKIVTDILIELEEGASCKLRDRMLDKSRRTSTNHALVAHDVGEAEEVVADLRLRNLGLGGKAMLSTRIHPRTNELES